MSGNTLGRIFRVTTWGESHGPALGCVIDGCPSGIEISRKNILEELNKDIPYPILSMREEPNDFKILSGIYDGLTMGTPISIIIQNRDVKSENYRRVRNIPRPGHADLSYRIKYGHVDWRGGSRSSGRTWIPISAAGGVAKRICDLRGIRIESRILRMGNEDIKAKNIQRKISEIADFCEKENDSTGGLIEVSMENLPCGLGAPFFNKFQADLGHAVLSVPGIKSFEVGTGREASEMKGSQFNDEFHLKNGEIGTYSNNAGGVLGGITFGSPVVFRAAVKPTPSIMKKQRSVQLGEMEEVPLKMDGRFDLNFTPRVLVIVEALASIITVDHMMLSGFVSHDSVIPPEKRLSFDWKGGDKQ